MDGAHFTPGDEFAGFRPGRAPAAPAALPPAQAAALRRAHELTVELTEVVASFRTRLAELEAAAPAGDEPGLPAGEMRAAFTSAREAADADHHRPRWADVLLPET
jgi:hypothetical protein